MFIQEAPPLVFSVADPLIIGAEDYILIVRSIVIAVLLSRSHVQYAQ